MTLCSAHEEQAHGPRAHFCVGDEGHAGNHWCLLGHVWTADENATEAVS